MEHEETRRYLLSIRNMAENLMKLTRPKGITTTKIIPSTNLLNIPTPILNLPFPSDLDTTLRTLGLSENGYSEAYHKIQDWVHNLQNIHSLNFQRACRELALLPHFQNPRSLVSAMEDIRFAYEKSYASYLPSITSYILSAQPKQNSSCKSAKTPFNNEYTPLLELYFEQNAYPPLPDRRLLARKSMMTMRQIEVWFQNHRARARKEGKVIKKLNEQYQPHLILESLNENTPYTSAMDFTRNIFIDNELKDDESSEDEASTTPPLSSCLFSQVTPPHAFPTVYPPNSPTDPFPNDNGKFMFPPPVWMRTPTHPKIQTVVPDIDEFISMFASKLHLRDGSRRRCAPRNFKRNKKPWFAPVVVIPAPAPHPALIRNPCTPPLFNSSAPSYSSFPLPAPPSQNPHKLRKFAPFSKRTPFAFSTNHTNQPTAFSAFASRTSSLGSVASSQRSSSLSSISSAEPATPPLSPTHQQGALFADHDYQLLDELFGPEPSQLLNNTSYATPDFLFPSVSLKDASYNPLYDLSSMFPPPVAQVHC